MFWGACMGRFKMCFCQHGRNSNHWKRDGKSFCHVFPVGKVINPQTLARKLEMNWYFVLFIYIYIYIFFFTRELKHASNDTAAEVQFLIFQLRPSDCHILYRCQSQHLLVCPYEGILRVIYYVPSLLPNWHFCLHIIAESVSTWPH